MCGLTGVVSFKESLKEEARVFADMQAALRRRGPDQEGMFTEGPAALIHTRLCVLDIENGRQPMIFERGREKYVLLYNGELYNTAELRAALTDRGHVFTGHSDTEVLLHAYAEWEAACVERLNGIFAFAVWECHRRRLFIARDRIGVKPFFYALQGGRFIFASEIKALLAHPGVPPEIDAQGIAEILLIGPGRTPGCGVFRGVEELLPGCCGYFDEAGLRLRTYWELTDGEHRDSFAQTVETVRFLVKDAIERQLVSDVPVGAFLSGGLDSGIIAAVAGRHFRESGKALRTFSVNYKDNERYFQASKFQPDSDAAYVELLSRHLGTEHHEVLLGTEELADALYAAVDARDLPGMADVDASLLLFCKEVKERVTVALSGECADEIFGGYPWYRDREIREKDGFPWAQSTDFRAGFLREEFAAEPDAPAYVEARYRKTVAETSCLPGTDGLERRMKEMMRLNFSWFMQTLLDRKDRMSMYSGLEVRVPFCDYRIAEYLYRVPWEMKDWQNREKGLLRRAASELLPPQVLWRKKSPYPKTHHPAYLQTVSAGLREVLAQPNAPLLQIARRDKLEALLSAERPAPWYGQLMTLPQTIAYFLQINYWLTKYRVRVV